ncbi:MAG: hypothetical protein AAF699_12020 [Pseudomonadota bacterium]
MKWSESLARIYRNTWRACLLLSVVSSLALSIAALALLPYRHEILDTLFGFFLPADWLASIHLANQALFRQLNSVLLFQSVAIVCFSLVSILFFPFRDRISLNTEKQLIGNAETGPGLAYELWLEAGLVLIAFNAYSISYLLAYFVGQPLFTYIDELALLLLTLFFILDLLSPPHFRRKLNCLYVLKALIRHPVKLLSFGLIFCLPIFLLELFLGDLVFAQQDDQTLAIAVVSIIVVNCLVCVFALPAGTWLALQIFEDQKMTALPASGRWGHKAQFGVQLLIAGGLFVFYAAVITTLSTKVPLKTADYEIQWLTMDYESGANGDPPQLSFDVMITNRHPSLGLEVDNAELLVNLEGRYLGEAGLNIPYVAPNSSISVPVDLQLRLDMSELAGIAMEELTSYFTEQQAPWRSEIAARLTVRLPLGLDLPIYIPEGYRQEFQER